jgi:hypothetical protein
MLAAATSQAAVPSPIVAAVERGPEGSGIGIEGEAAAPVGPRSEAVPKSMAVAVSGASGVASRAAMAWKGV